MNVLMPAALSQALDLRAQGAVPVAGATDLWVHWPVRPDAHDSTYLDLSGIDSLRAIVVSHSHITLGALTTYWDVITDDTCKAEYSILISAARQVGAIQIQSRGTWAGNIANASPAADGVLALMVLDAQVLLTSASRSERSVPLDAFYTGYKVMKMEKDELITAIRIPRLRRAFDAFIKVGARRAQAITKVGVAVVLGESGWKVAMNSMAPTIRRCTHVEELLANGRVPGISQIREVIESDVSPIDDIRSDRQYRLRVAAQVLHDALTRAANERRLL